MQADLIRQVRDAEIRAEEKSAEAQTQAEAIVREARRQAVEARLETLEHARHRAQEHFEHGARAFEPEIAQLRQTSQADIDRDAQHVQRHFEAAVDFVVTHFYAQFTQE